jgi:aryl-alcohol dehydrogenase-like predicted oxidoreductase
MKHRNLGKLDVSALGIGCMPMAGNAAGFYGAVDEREALATIGRAIDLGVTLFDTAEVYGPFVNERQLGEGIKGRREDVVVATKFMMAFDADGRAAGLDGSPANARRACEASLKRLGIDCIDLFYLHRVDPNVPIEESVGGMADLVREGKVRHLGLSEAGPETIRRAHATHPIAALQSEYSLWERGVERDILPVTRELGIGFVPYSPLGRGFLAGHIDSRETLSETDYRRRDPRYDDGNIGHNMKIVEAVRTVAARHGVSPARVALAWLLTKGPDIVPIPGTKRRSTMEDSIAAADLLLSDEDIGTLEDAAPVGSTAGDRYQEWGMKMVRL